MKKIKAGIVGGTSLLAGLLIRILEKHPKVELVYVDSEHHSGEKFSVHHKYLLSDIAERRFDKYSKEFINDNLDVVFIAKPHKVSMKYVKEIFNNKIKIIDLSGDFRIKKISEYEKWYKTEHIARELVDKAVYGLSEINRDKIKDSKLVANPGCYPTGILLALYPIMKNKIFESNIITIISYSGVSGAGKNYVPGKNLFTEAFNNIIAYKVAQHQHTPEIEENLSIFAQTEIKIDFVPHITSIENGIFSTIVLKIKANLSEEKIYEMYKREYENSKFIKIFKDNNPEIKDVVDTNYCAIKIKKDERTGNLIILSAIDNRIKGGAGQAVQNMNIMFNIEETAGLL